MIEDNQELQELILTIHHSFTITLAHTDKVKIIQNNKNASYIKRAH